MKLFINSEKMKLFINSDTLPTLFFIALSLFACQQAVVVGLGTFTRPGAGFLPFGAGASMGLFSIICLIQTIVSKERQDGAAPDERLPEKKKVSLTPIILSLFAYTTAVYYLGFLPSTFVFVIFIYRLVESEKWWRAAVEAAIISIVNYYIFVELFDVNLPKPFYAW